MADTRQIVQWTLEQSCALRSSEESKTQPKAAAESVQSAKSYSSALRNPGRGFGVFGDVFVSSYVLGYRPDGGIGAVDYPSGGFVVSKEFSSAGSAEALFAMCHRCPANPRSHELAGCVGSLFQSPQSEETESQLRGIISRLGLEQDVATCFPETHPLWYGLWAISPAPASSLPVLKTLLAAMLAEDQREMEAAGKVDHRQIRNFASIISAIESAKQRNLRLHVQLLPLGHTDFGIYTIFPHCPFCKANAPVKPWQRRYPTELFTCEVCGTKYSPSETASMRRMDSEDRSLREALGIDGFLRFAKEYLIARGETPEAADGIIEETETMERQREEKVQKQIETNRRRDVYLDTHVFAGLPSVPKPRSELFDDEDPAPEASGRTKWFAGDTFAEVLRRSERLGIKAMIMQHSSADGENDRIVSNGIKEPLTLLSQWRSEGCTGKFHAHFRVPDSLLPGHQ